MPFLTRPRRFPAAVAALAIVGVLAFAAPAQADDASVATDTAVTAPVVDESVAPTPVEAPAEEAASAEEAAPVEAAPVESTPAEESVEDDVVPAEGEAVTLAPQARPAALAPAAPATLNTGCPTSTVNVTIDDAADLSYDSKSGGSSSLTTNGLEVAWHGVGLDLSNSKVAWYYATNFPLSQLGTPSITYTQTSGSSVGQNFSIIDNGSWKGNIVTEPGIDDYWTTFTIPGFVNPPNTPSYRKAVGTVEQFLAAYAADTLNSGTAHDVRVVAIGGSGGSGSEGTGIVKAQSAGCYNITFAAPPVPTNTGCTSTRVPVVIDAASDLTYDSKSGGSSSVTAKGLEVAWHGVGIDLSNSKVAWYYPTNFPLSQLGTPSINYSTTTGASVGQNFTISVDGAWKGNIVKEPGIDNYWTTFTIPGFVNPPNTPTYRKAVGTIDQFLAAYWADNRSHVITVIAVGGSGGSGSEGTGILKAQSAGCYDLSYGVPAPTVEQCLPANAVKVAVTAASQLTYDSKSGGSSSVTSKGLQVAWHGVGIDLSNSKVAWYYPTNFPLTKLGTPSINYTQTSGASVGQNFTVTVDGVWKGNIVKEPGIDDYWTTFTIPGFVNPPNTPSYRKAVGTIQDFVNAYWLDDMTHDVRVIAIGGSGGSGSEGVGVVKSQKAGCYELTYGIPAVTPPVTTPGTDGGFNDGLGNGTGTSGAAAGTGAASTPTPTPAPSSSAAGSGSGSSTDNTDTTDELPTEAFGSETTSGVAPWWPWALGAGILLILALLWFLVFRKRFGNQS